MCGLGQVTGFSESQVFFIYKMGAIGAGVIFQLVKHLPCEHENLNSSHRFYVKKKKKPSVLESRLGRHWEAGGSLKFTDSQSSLSNELQAKQEMKQG